MGNSRDKKLYEKTKHTFTGWFNIHFKRVQQRQRTKFGKDLNFDRWELEQWILNYKYDMFMELFKQWKENDYEKDLVPSIDRIDCMKPYTFDNMQIVTWKINREKFYNEEMNKYSKNCEQMVKHTRKKVNKYNLDGDFIKEYRSISEASRENNISVACICECCQGKRKTAGRFRWTYV